MPRNDMTFTRPCFTLMNAPTLVAFLRDLDKSVGGLFCHIIRNVKATRKTQLPAQHAKRTRCVAPAHNEVCLSAHALKTSSARYIYRPSNGEHRRAIVVMVQLLPAVR